MGEPGFLPAMKVKNFVVVNGVEEPPASQVAEVLERTTQRIRTLAQQTSKGEISPGAKRGKVVRELRDRDAAIVDLLGPKIGPRYQAEVDKLAARED